jgi:NodT family efflux transporter outer membrane factor (OMF) lipoprotein
MKSTTTAAAILTDYSHRLGLFLLCSTLLSGCMIGQDFSRPDADVPENWLTKSDDALRTTAPKYSQWWESFNDPSLSALIDAAGSDSLSLRIAGLRVYESRALLGRIRGSLYPQIQTLNGGYSRVDLSKNSELIQILPEPIGDLTDSTYDNYGIGATAAWEMDFWGRFRRGIEAADANLERNLANFGDALVTLQGEVASTYILLRTLQEQLAIAQTNVDIQTRSLEIAGVRLRNGLTTELDTQQARALLRDTQSLIPELHTGIRQTKNALSLLVGRSPSDLNDLLVGDQNRLPVVPDVLSVGVPSELLRRRPDVRRAEMLAASQSALIGVAKADLYPAFRLAGSVGYAADSTGDLFESDSFTGIGTFGFMWKFLDYGRTKNRIRAQDARFQQAIAGYQLAVINAAREVEDAIVGYTGAQDEAELRADAVSAAQRAVELAMVQYRDGVTNYTTVLDTQRFQLLAQSRYTQTRGDVAAAVVATYKALGGGWDPAFNGNYVPDDVLEEMTTRTNWGDLLTPAGGSQ